MTGLAVRNLRVERGGRPILADLSFDVRHGTALSVTGPNGAGKSTLLRALAGLLPCAAGTIAMAADGLGDASVAEQAHYLGHGNGLKPALTALDNLVFQERWGGSPGVMPAAALAAVDLAHVADFPVGLLSAGQRRRVALAGLLVSRRPLWLLDEPATALDIRSEALLVALIRTHLATDGIVVAALHAPLPIGSRSLQLGRS